MHCYKHMDATAVGVCMACGQHICADCSVNIDSLYYCKDCVAQMANSQGHGPATFRANSGPGPGQNHQGSFNYFNAGNNIGYNNYNYNHRQAPAPPRRYRKSGFLLLLLSAIPGLNYMYLGLMKRGLFMMTLFFGIVFVAFELETRLLMFSFYILICFSLFDGFRIRRLLMDGFVVPDAADDILTFFKEHKKPILLFLAVAILFGLIGRVGRLFINASTAVPGALGNVFGITSNLISFLAGLLLIVVGCYVVAKFISKRGE